MQPAAKGLRRTGPRGAQRDRILAASLPVGLLVATSLRRVGFAGRTAMTTDSCQSNKELLMHKPTPSNTPVLVLLSLCGALSACSSETLSDERRSDEALSLTRAAPTTTVGPPISGITLPQSGYKDWMDIIYYQTPDAMMYWLHVTIWSSGDVVSSSSSVVGGPENLGLTDQTPAAGTRSLYARSANGDLNWFRTQTWDWSHFPNEAVVGWGWGAFDRLVGAGEGILYGVQPNGDLVWYNHLGHETGSFAWAGPATVGWGWGSAQYKEIFSGGDGVVYAIQPDGQLVWWRHNGYKDGSAAWDGPVTIGWGWQDMVKVFSGGRGGIYALSADGTLRRYRHLTWNAPTATPSWGVTKDVTTGLPTDVHSMFALLY